jgi:hypothetical protein
MPITILPVQGPEGLAEFIEFPWTVYADDPSWIPPLRQQIFFELSDASAFARYGRRQLYLCQVDGQPVGRIGASVNPRLVDASGAVIGQLGYFECVNDSGVAGALVEAGVAWLRTQGAREIVGPMNGGAHRTHRLMTRGFEGAPFLFEPRNPPYYPTLFEGCGFTPVHRWFGYEFDRRRAEQLLHQFDRILARRPPPGELVAIPLDRPDEIIGRLYRLLDGCWEGHVGYAALDLAEFTEVFRGALSIMQPGNVTILVQDGRDVGFRLILPDYADEMRALGGDASGWGRWLGAVRAHRLILHTAALLPEARSSSAAMALVNSGIRHAVEGGFEEVVVALAVEGFISRIGEQTREYALYSYTRR